MDILVALEGQQHFGGCVVGLAKCNDSMPCPQHELYKPVRQRLRDYLQSTTVADLGLAMKAKKRQIAKESGAFEPPSKQAAVNGERKVSAR
jgi:Rrf2 family transcriptional regulator, iron-sulfur cluster assembly transcription factor